MGLTSRAIRVLVLISIIIYRQNEYIGKYWLELCSKYDREHDFERHAQISRTLSQADMDMLQAFK